MVWVVDQLVLLLLGAVLLQVVEVQVGEERVAVVVAEH